MPDQLLEAVRGQQAPRIAQFPDFSRLNPDIDMYRDALERAGGRVIRHALYPAERGRQPLLSWRWIWRNRRQVDILLLHQHQRLYLRKGIIASYLTLAHFISALTLARIAGMCIGWNAGNLYPHERPYPNLDVLARRAVVRLTNLVIADSEDAKQVLVSEFPAIRRIEVIPQGNYIDIFGTLPDRKQARRELGIGNGEFVYLYFGLIRPYKGVLQLVEAYQRTFATDPGFRLVIAGEPVNDAMRADLEIAIRDHPRILALLEYASLSTLRACMAAADVAVLPFEEIFASTTKLAAASAGLPCICPRNMAWLEGEDTFNIQFDVGNQSSLCDALHRTVDSRPLLPAWSETAKQQVLLRDWADVGATLLRAMTIRS